jgi:hypothetical protein
MSSRKQPDAEKRQFWRLVFEEHTKSGLSVRLAFGEPHLDGCFSLDGLIPIRC